MTPTFNHTCQCGHTFEVADRDSIHYWPDHLWAGKISAEFRCPSCRAWNYLWAHELPEEFHADWQRLHWQDYKLPRLLFSAILHGFIPYPEEHQKPTLLRRLLRGLVLRVAKRIIVNDKCFNLMKR